MVQPSWLSDLPLNWEEVFKHDPDFLDVIRKRVTQDLSLELPKAFAKYIENVKGYAKEVLGIQLWDKQAQVAASFIANKYTIVVASFGVGKTFVVGTLINWWFDVFDPSIALTTAPTWPQVEKLLWGEIASQRPSSSVGKLFKTELRDHPKHFALGLSTDKEERFQGFHEERICVALDEGPGVRKPVWDAAVDNIPVGPDNRIIAIGNPLERSGPFYEATNDPAWHCIHISAIEHPNIKAELAGESPPFPKAVRLEWVQERIRKWCSRFLSPEPEEKVYLFEFPPGSGQWWKPNPLAQSKLLGWFPEEGSDQIIPMAAIESAIARIEKSGFPVRMGIDVARGGEDESVIALFQGNHARIIWTYEGNNTMEIVGNAVRFIRQYLPQEVRVDVIGVGSGVYDRLKELEKLKDLPEGCVIVSVGVGESPVKEDDFTEEFSQLRDQLWWMMRLGIHEMDLPDDDILRSQLIAPTWAPTSRGRIKVEEKKEMKKRGVKSPDRAEALMLAWPDVGFFEKVGWKKLKFLSPGTVVVREDAGIPQLRYLLQPPFTIRGPVTQRLYVFRTKKPIPIEEVDYPLMRQIKYSSMGQYFPMFR